MRSRYFARSRVVAWPLVGLLAALIVGLAIGSSTRAAYPGTNGRIAFSDGSIGTINADGTDRVSLTSGAYDFYPSWSPDGRRIAFSRYLETPSESMGVYVMNADGSGLQLITDPSMSALHPTWSPDGERLAFAGMTVTDAGVWSGPWDIHVINLNGTGLTRLTQSAPENSGAGWIFPAWAPTGERIAAVNRADSGLYLIDADGANPVRLTSATQDPAWSPDGQWLAFADANQAISLIQPDGTGQVTLTDPAGGEDRRPAWSPDGTRIVYESRRGEPTLIALTIMDADGTDAVRMEETTSWASEPDWGRAPDSLPSPEPSETPSPSSFPSPTPQESLTPDPSLTPEPSETPLVTPQPSGTPPPPSETPAPSPIEPDGPLVEADGTQLTLNGEPYTFVGMNVYNANTRVHSCWYPFTQSELEASFVEMGEGIDVIRAWFFQDFATVNGERSWTAFDETLAAAKATGKKVVVTLGNQWADCDIEGLKTRDWYESGYTEPNAALPASYRDYVAEVVSRYAGESTVLMWQLLNEAEVPIHTPEGLCDEEVAHPLLKNWAADVSTLIKTIDPYHLVSIGTIGSGQCGAQYTDYKSLHDLPTVDLCEFHDYTEAVMPGDQWNGLAFRIEQCNELNKPIFVGEVGVDPQWLDGTLEARAELLHDKITTQMDAGVVGEVIWAWNAFESRTDTYDIGPGDPLFGFLRPTIAPSAADDVVAIAPGGAETDILPLDNDTDADGDVLSMRSFTQPQRGTVNCDTTACRYMPDSEGVSYDWFTYVVHDGRGGTDEAVVELWWATDIPAPDEALAPVDDTWGQLWWPHANHYNGRAQSFTASTTGNLARIDLSLSQWDVTDEWLTVEIREGDDPSGPILTTGLLRQEGIPLYESAWVYAWKPIGFTNPARVEAGERYTIVLAPAEKTGVDVPALIWWGTGDVYVRGTGYTHEIGHGPVTPGWSEIGYATGVIDLGFRAYVLAADADGDGVDDSIGTGSGGFDDGGGTAGSIVDTAGHDVLVASDPDGVKITVEGVGTDKATFTVCGFILRLAPGSEVVLSCGSITTRVISGSAELVLGDGLTVVTVPEGVIATLDEGADGSFSLSGISGGSVTVTVDGVSNTAAPGQTLTLRAWDFIGFDDPVNNDSVLNVVKAGQAVPLRWRVLDASGAPVSDLANATVRVSSLACSAGAGSDQLEETGAGNSKLQNLGDGYYQLNWKTPKTYANLCKTMRLDIGDGVEHTALFRFTK